MFTIIGSGVNIYSLKEIGSKINWANFDCILADSNFNTVENTKLIPPQIEANFLKFNEIKQLLKKKILQDQNILYVVTGNPLFYSAAKEIFEFLNQEISGFNANDVNIITGESSKDYLLKKLKISENDLISLSLHGRKPLTLDLSKFLHAKYTFLLCDENSLKFIAEETQFIKQDVTFYLGSKLGSDNENIKRIDLHKIAKELSWHEIKQTLMPYVILIERDYDFSSSISQDQNFLTNEGMLTKTSKRFLTIQALDLKSNMLLWDIGAGSGSVSIDSYKIFKTRSILFEKNKQQCDFIQENLAKHKVIGAKLFKGNVLDNYFTAITPDRIFIGGGGKEVLSKIIDFYNELNNTGILVANIICLEHFTMVVEILKNSDLNYKIRTISIDNYNKMTKNSKLSISEPERTLFQIIINK